MIVAVVVGMVWVAVLVFTVALCRASERGDDAMVMADADLQTHAQADRERGRGPSPRGARRRGAVTVRPLGG